VLILNQDNVVMLYTYSRTSFNFQYWWVTSVCCYRCIRLGRVIRRRSCL